MGSRDRDQGSDLIVDLLDLPTHSHNEEGKEVAHQNGPEDRDVEKTEESHEECCDDPLKPKQVRQCETWSSHHSSPTPRHPSSSRSPSLRREAAGQKQNYPSDRMPKFEFRKLTHEGLELVCLRGGQHCGRAAVTGVHTRTRTRTQANKCSCSHKPPWHKNPPTPPPSASS